MQFLRDNVFLVGVVAVLVIGLAVLLALYLDASSGYADTLKPKLQLAGEISNTRLVKPDSETLAQIRNERDRINQMRADVKEVMGGQGSRYQVLKVLGDDAFPVGNKYNQSRALTAFTDAYIEETRRLLETLGPVKYVSRADVDELEKVEFSRIEQMIKDEAVAAAAAGTTTPSTTPMMMPGGYPDPRMMMGPGGYDPRMMAGMPMPSGTAAAPRDPRTMATQNVTARVQLQQANNGRIYASLSSLDRHWDKTAITVRDLPDIKKLWEAQMNLWVQKDIIDAINIVNGASQVGGTPSVLHSGVRSLESIRVNRSYVTGSAAAPSSSSSGRTSGPASPMPMPMPGGYGPDPYGGYGGAYGGAYGGPYGGAYGGGYGGAPVAAAPTGPGTTGFTGRGSSTDYDVIHYTFTVVMPPQRMLDLYKALYSLGFHTILDVEFAALPPQAAVTARTGASSSGSVAPGTSVVPPYYGPGAMARVTITGELQIPTAFHRGVYNSVERKWDVAPLIPWEVLEELQGRAREALRPEDNTRIIEKNNMQPAAARP